MIWILIAFWIVFGTIFGLIFGAFWGQTSALNRTRKAYQLRFVFRLDFGSLLASSWVPSWPHFRLQGGGPVRGIPLLTSLCFALSIFLFSRPSRDYLGPDSRPFSVPFWEGFRAPSGIFDARFNVWRTFLFFVGD